MGGRQRGRQARECVGEPKQTGGRRNNNDHDRRRVQSAKPSAVPTSLKEWQMKPDVPCVLPFCLLHCYKKTHTPCLPSGLCRHTGTLPSCARSAYLQVTHTPVPSRRCLRRIPDNQSPTTTSRASGHHLRSPSATTPRPRPTPTPPTLAILLAPHNRSRIS